jgi:large subunit ribosomal protein L21
VAEGQTVRLEKIEVALGESVEVGDILMVSNGDDVKIGMPFVDGGKVTAEVVTHGRGDKVNIVKFRRRKHSRKQMGHRQWFTEVKITGISA